MRTNDTPLASAMESRSNCRSGSSSSMVIWTVDIGTSGGLGSNVSPLLTTKSGISTSFGVGEAGYIVSLEVLYQLRSLPIVIHPLTKGLLSLEKG